MSIIIDYQQLKELKEMLNDEKCNNFTNSQKNIIKDLNSMLDIQIEFINEGKYELAYIVNQIFTSALESIESNENGK